MVFHMLLLLLSIDQLTNEGLSSGATTPSTGTVLSVKLLCTTPRYVVAEDLHLSTPTSANWKIDEVHHVS